MMTLTDRIGDARCYLFDLDGTLVDSMAYWRALTVRQSRAKYGHLAGYSEELEVAISVLTYKQSRELISRTFAIPLESVTTDREYTRGMMRLFYSHAVEEKAECCRILREAHARGVKTALLTATRLNTMSVVLDKLDIRDHLDLILTPDDHPKGKSDVTIFLDAMHRLGVTPAETVLFEDSYYSMCVAHELGIRVIAVEDYLNRFDRERIREIAGEVYTLGACKQDVSEEEILRTEALFGRTCDISARN